MDQQVFAKLSELPPLEPVPAKEHPCKICDDPAAPFDVVDFNKFCDNGNYYCFGLSGVLVNYYRCRRCGFMFTKFFDDWSNEDFKRFIYNEDYIKVDPEYVHVRPTQQAEVASKVLKAHQNSRILDYGSGTGAFGTKLSESGFTNVVNYDPFSNPTRPEGLFDIITCFEVLEHSADPVATICDVQSLLKADGTILFSTGTQPENIQDIRARWWYVGPRNGHISIFTIEALSLLGQRVGLTLYRGGVWPAFRNESESIRQVTDWDYIGHPFNNIVLGAPEADEIFSSQRNLFEENWESPEDGLYGRFRWTRTNNVQWLLNRTCSGSTLKVTIPYLMEVTEGFAEQCWLSVGEQSEKVILDSFKMTATIMLSADFDGIITLHTPAPISPASLRESPDNRQIGLAIPIQPASKTAY